MKSSRLIFAFAAMASVATAAAAGAMEAGDVPDASAVAHAELCKKMQTDVAAEGKALGEQVTDPSNVSCDLGRKFALHGEHQAALIDACYREFGWTEEKARDEMASMYANARGAVVGCVP